jgi:hypothetical protein
MMVFLTKKSLVFSLPLTANHAKILHFLGAREVQIWFAIGQFTPPKKHKIRGFYYKFFVGPNLIPLLSNWFNNCKNSCLALCDVRGLERICQPISDLES